MPNGSRVAHRRRSTAKRRGGRVRRASIRRPTARSKWRKKQWKLARWTTYGGIGVAVAISAAAPWIVSLALGVMTLGLLSVFVEGFRHAPKQKGTWLHRRLVEMERWLRGGRSRWG